MTSWAMASSGTQLCSEKLAQREWRVLGVQALSHTARGHIQLLVFSSSLTSSPSFQFTACQADHDTWRKPKQKGGAASKEKAQQD